MVGEELTREARLAHFSPSPVQIIAFRADPIARLLLSRTFIACVDNRRILVEREGK